MITVGDIRKTIDGAPDAEPVRLFVLSNADEPHYVELEGFLRAEAGFLIRLTVECPNDSDDVGDPNSERPWDDD